MSGVSVRKSKKGHVAVALRVTTTVGLKIFSPTCRR
jgi:hypothetical protein